MQLADCGWVFEDSILDSIPRTKEPDNPLAGEKSAIVGIFDNSASAGYDSGYHGGQMRREVLIKLEASRQDQAFLLPKSLEAV